MMWLGSDANEFPSCKTQCSPANRSAPVLIPSNRNFMPRGQRIHKPQYGPAAFLRAEKGSDVLSGPAGHSPDLPVMQEPCGFAFPEQRLRANLHQTAQRKPGFHAHLLALAHGHLLPARKSSQSDSYTHSMGFVSDSIYGQVEPNIRRSNSRRRCAGSSDRRT